MMDMMELNGREDLHVQNTIGDGAVGNGGSAI